MAVDLPEPRVLRAPAVIHRHRPLREGVQRKALVPLDHVSRRRIPEGQGIEIGLNARAMLLGRSQGAVAAGGKAHLLDRLAVELEDRGRGGEAESLFQRPLDVVAVDMAVVAHVLGQVMRMKAAVGDILLELARIDVALGEVATVLSAMADYIGCGGPSRGSALVLDGEGTPLPNLGWRCRPYGTAMDGMVHETRLTMDNGRPTAVCTLRPVRPIPRRDLWFENVWADFRSKAVYD